LKRNVTAFALAFGIWWGVGIFVLTWWLIAVGDTATMTGLLERIYVGYSVSAAGSIIGLAWGFVCGAICGGILAWLYNFLADRVGAGTEYLEGKSA